MNGNFEFDKGSYPYAAQRRGDTYQVVHVPTQAVVYANGVPQAVAIAVALSINTAHYRNDATMKAHLLGAGVYDTVRTAARESLNSRLITATVYDQVVRQSRESEAVA